ncbi:hypothetical protein WR25_23824 [Diploscapter pachys]|uniref:L-Fucosyltransferase n=1 Tax=Diploscapter pachys TaxID=2018661 RepID=A0A2A2J814_9BILA|nr:hypothetical protein WR25_23824 [Diploscapter pachys]
MESAAPLGDSTFSMSQKIVLRQTSAIIRKYGAFSLKWQNSSLPMRLIREKATHVELKTKYVQNSNYFEKYIDDLMEYFEFSEEIKMQGDKLIQKYNIAKLEKHQTIYHFDTIHANGIDVVVRNANIDETGFLCVHTRRTDHFAPSGLGFTVPAIKFILNRDKLDKVFMFGDDERFMNDVLNTIKADEKYANIKGIVNFNTTIGEDLYLSSKICSAFLISTSESTFGWFLAFLVQNQEKVYFRHNMRPESGAYSGTMRHMWKPLFQHEETNSIKTLCGNRYVFLFPLCFTE